MYNLFILNVLYGIYLKPFSFLFLKYSSDIIKFTFLKCIKSVILVYSQGCAIIFTSSRIFSSPTKETLCSLAIITHSPLPSPLATGSLLSVLCDLPSHVNRITRVFFFVCFWLLSLSIMISWFISVACDRASFLF